MSPVLWSRFCRFDANLSARMTQLATRRIKRNALLWDARAAASPSGGVPNAFLNWLSTSGQLVNREPRLFRA